MEEEELWLVVEMGREQGEAHEISGGNWYLIPTSGFLKLTGHWLLDDTYY